MGWTKAIKLWHDEISNFVYDADGTGVTGHYTQVSSIQCYFCRVLTVCAKHILTN
jgi:hypothetical protein